MKAEKIPKVLPAGRSGVRVTGAASEAQMCAEKGTPKVLLEQIGAGLGLLDANMRVIWANKESKCRFSLLGDLIGRQCYRAAKGRSEPCSDCSAVQALATGKVQTSIIENTTPAGEIRYYQQTAAPILDSSGRVIQVIILAHDVTDLRQAERELLKRAESLEIQSRRAAEASRRKSRFLASVSHDLRIPLTSIIGFVELLVEDTDEPVTESQRQMLLKVRQSAEKLIAMIENLLDLSKIESGKMTVNLSQVNLPTLIGQVVETMMPLVKDKEVVLGADVAEDLPALYTDEQKLSQVLANLISNAIKFTPKGAVTVRAIMDGSMVCIAVADTGVGIRRADFRRIFEEFTQVGGPRARRSGTGLGLAIARKLVHLLGGEIHLASKLGKGSTFTIRLPVSPSRALLARRSRSLTAS